MVRSHSGSREDLCRDASRQSAIASARSGVDIRQLTTNVELRECAAIFDAIWQPGSGASLLGVEVLQALATSGNYVAGAFGEGQLLGACVGFWGPPDSRSMHSHIAGVAVDARGRDLGYALKLHQRASALAQGVDTLTWTFDPLVRRNAHFNIRKLGGHSRVYLVNHYGSVRDAINAGDESDRLLVEWDLVDTRTVRCCSTTASEPVIPSVPSALTVDAHGAPVVAEVLAPTVTVAVPPDIEHLRRHNPQLAGRWRAEVRSVLGGALDAGGRIEGFDREKGYIVNTGELS